MKNLTYLFFVIVLFTMNGCKKSSSSPSVVGKWTFSNITGTTTSESYSSSLQTTTYSYSNTMLTQSFSTGTPNLFSVTTELWTFNNDGTYSINENFTNNGNTEVHSTNGSWGYLGNTKSNSELVFTSDQSYLLPNGTYTIQKVDNNQLTLAINNTSTTNYTYGGSTSVTINTTNVVITFTRQQ